MCQYFDYTLKMDELGCSQCHLNKYCFIGLSREIISARYWTQGWANRIVHGGDTIFENGASLHHCSVLRTGMLVAERELFSKESYVIEIYYPGDIIGLTLNDQGTSMARIRAIETSNICELNCQSLAKLLSHHQNTLHNILSQVSEKSLHCDKSYLQLNSIRRVAKLLYEVYRRKSRQGIKLAEYYCNLTQREIASYLGLRTETVCRDINRLHDKELILSRARYYSIPDSKRLLAFIHPN